MRPLVGQARNLFKRPDVICHARDHRGRHTKRLMDALGLYANKAKHESAPKAVDTTGIVQSALAARPAVQLAMAGWKDEA